MSSVVNRGGNPQAAAAEFARQARETGRPAQNEIERASMEGRDPKVMAGRIAGQEKAKELYGISGAEIGTEVQDIARRRKERMSGTSPQDTALRNTRNQQVRAMRAAGKSEEEISQMERNMGMNIAQQQYQNVGAATGDYQKLMGNILGGSTSLEMGFAGLEKAGSMPQAPGYGGGGGGGLFGALGSVICTELYSQGYLSKEIYEKDARYGRLIRLNDPNLYIGYRFYADPIVVLMKKSKVLTKIVSLIAVPWANDMAMKGSKFGAVVNVLGSALCKLTGNFLVRRYHAEEV